MAKKQKDLSEKAASAISRLSKMRTPSSPGDEATKYVTFAIKTVREASAEEIALDAAAEKFVYVEGILAGEEPDFEGEILDYKSSKPNFQRWNSNAQKLTGGKSVGNLRGQHNAKIAAGIFVEMGYDDKALSIPCVAKVIDPTECDKVREGVYTSFSVGAHYARKWKDGKYVRWTADPFEGSLVDFGAIPMTRGFTYRAADGTEEERPFDGGRRQLREAFEILGKPLSVEQEDRVLKTVSSLAAARKGLYTISGFAQLMQGLIGLRESIVFEREIEGDASPVTDRVAEATDELLECLAAYTQEEVSEEIGKGNKNSKEEKTVDIKDLAKDLPQTTVAATTEPAAKAAGDDTKPTDEEVTSALKSVNGALAILKAAGITHIADALKGYPEHPGSDDHGKSAKEKCKMKAEDCTDEDCDDHKKSKAKSADEKCKKSAEECTDEKCMSHKGKSKAAAAGSNDDSVGLKRADVNGMIRDHFTEFKTSFENDVVKPLSEQLKAIGEAVTAIGAAPVQSKVALRATTVVSKDAEVDQDAQDADKAIRQDVKNGRTVDAVLRIRERGGNRVSL